MTDDKFTYRFDMHHELISIELITSTKFQMRKGYQSSTIYMFRCHVFSLSCRSTYICCSTCNLILVNLNSACAMASNEIPSAKPQTFAKAGVKCEEILGILRFVFLIPRRRNSVTRDMNLLFVNKRLQNYKITEQFNKIKGINEYSMSKKL